VHGCGAGLFAQEELRHLYSLDQKRGLSAMANKLDVVKDASFGLAILLNILIVVAFGVKTNTWQLVNPRSGT
jgi:hypothetical protein